jgi:hypothetical protein
MAELCREIAKQQLERGEEIRRLYDLCCHHWGRGKFTLTALGRCAGGGFRHCVNCTFLALRDLTPRPSPDCAFVDLNGMQPGTRVGCNAAIYKKLIEFFDHIWPNQELEWPADIPRPEKTLQKIAGHSSSHQVVGTSDGRPSRIQPVVKARWGRTKAVFHFIDNSLIGDVIGCVCLVALIVVGVFVVGVLQ